ncbi:MAG: cell filamentation protein Fic [Akkermansiaceae bacterium]|nr:cell filamentation protein Fic [Akkermansiaceae bacterium]
MNTELQFLLYDDPAEKGNINVVVKDDTIWATQKTIAELYEVQTPAISKHLKNIYEEGELEESSTISKMEIVVNRGFRGAVKEDMLFYNLDAIISVGYRVNSRKATRFRQWATRTLNEYIRKGFVMDDERLKQGKTAFGKDYFRELLERVRSIRASERRIWQQITDIFAECSIDYDRESQTCRNFYAMVQNRFHYAITGRTAAEIVYDSADHTKENMGLLTWKHAPDGRILKSDVTVAKNYLDEKQIRRLERAVTGFFDYIEDLVERENSFNMAQFAESVNEFLAFRRYELLPDKGRISHAQAEQKAHAEYDIFNKTQLINSDFDKLVQRTRQS